MDTKEKLAGAVTEERLIEPRDPDWHYYYRTTSPRRHSTRTHNKARVEKRPERRLAIMVTTRLGGLRPSRYDSHSRAALFAGRIYRVRPSTGWTEHPRGDFVDPGTTGFSNLEGQTKLTDQDKMLSRLGQHGKDVSLHNLLKRKTQKLRYIRDSKRTSGTQDTL